MKDAWGLLGNISMSLCFNDALVSPMKFQVAVTK